MTSQWRHQGLAEPSTESTASETASEAASVPVSVASMTVASVAVTMASVVTVVSGFRIGHGYGGKDRRDGDQDGRQGEEELHRLPEKNEN